MGRVTSDGEPGPDQGSSLTNEGNIVAKHAKKTASAAIARTGARTTASVAVAAAGLLALSGVANATSSKGGDGGSMIQNTEVDGAGGGGGDQGNSADGLIPILNNNDINVQANVCDVLNNVNVDVIEVLSELNVPVLNEIEGGVGRTNVGDTSCGNSSEQNDTNTSADSDDTTIIGGGGGKDGGGKGDGGKGDGGKGDGGKGDGGKGDGGKGDGGKGDGGKGDGGKGSEDDQVSKKPSGGVDTGDGSSSETDGIAYLLGGLALTAAGGTAFAARRTARQNS